MGSFKSGQLALVVGCVLAASGVARAVPTLQLYLEGSTYNSVTESWELAPAGSSGGAPFRLWTIGNVSGPGGMGSIEDVRLSIVYDKMGPAPTITLTPSTTGGFGGFADPSTPFGTGGLLQTVSNGTTPILGDGSSLPSHGEYGHGRQWQEFSLGDFTLSDSHIADFIDAFPDSPIAMGAQINVYDITVLGGSGLVLHFDLYDTIVASNHAKFAPFSHDATIVPIPGGALLGVVGFGMIGWLKKRRLA